MILRRLLAAGLLLAALAFPRGTEASQGNCVMPTTGTVSGLTFSQNINTCFAAILTANSGASAPTNGTGGAAMIGQLWLNSTSKALSIFDGVAWLRIATLDDSNNIMNPPIGGGVNTIASATTTDLCSVAQSSLTISGTTTITSFSNTCTTGQIKALTFSGALLLTHNATSLILPTAANITTVAGDTLWAVYLGGGNWKVLMYQRADGTALNAGSNFTGAVFYNSVITPTTLAANTNDWNPTSLASANTIRVAASSAVNLTGIVAPATDSKLLVVHNIGSFNITLTSQDAASTAANRFVTPYNYVLRPANTVLMFYDITTARWRIPGAARAPLMTVQDLISGTGATYTPAAGVTWIRVKMVGGGGGGGARTTNNGTAGGDTLFESWTAIKGNGGATNAGAGGAGGTGGADGTGTKIIRITGQAGAGGPNNAAAISPPGGNGGVSCFFGGGVGVFNATPTAAIVNTGGGGAGGDGSSSSAGSGGGAGECVEFVMTAPLPAITYTIGAAGTGGAAGGRAGGNAATGRALVEEHYN